MTQGIQSRLGPGFGARADDVLRQAAERENGVPGVVAMVTGANATIYECAAGRRDLGRTHPMTTDTVMSIYSCTKALTATAVLQLVEAQLVDLEDAAKEYVPEIAGCQVLAGFDASGEPRLRSPKSDITVRQLLLHTAGFGYEFFNFDLLRYGKTRYAAGAPTTTIPVTRRVLLTDPGTRWEYGSNLDWAGKVVESVRGERLGETLRKNILDPLEMHDTAFALSPGMRERRATIHQRDIDGTLQPDPKLGLPPEPQVDMGGSGLFSTAGDYLKFIRMILNDGAAPGGERIVKAETIQSMATDGLAPLKVVPLPGAIPSLAHDVEFFPGLPKSWGYSWMINDETAPTGRPAGSLGWCGLANLYYWIDRCNGIGGFWATQILPFIDGISFPAYLEFETAVYAHLT